MKRIRFLFLIIALFLMVHPLNAYAESASQVRIGSITLDQTNIYAQYKNGTLALGGNENDYNIKFSGGKVTLQNLESGFIQATGDLDLTLIGTNKLQYMYIDDGSISIDGSGQLELQYINVDNDFMMKGTGSISVNRPNVSGYHANSYGIQAANLAIYSGRIDVTTKGITASGNWDPGDGYGIYCSGNIDIHGGKLSVQTGYTTNYSNNTGIYVKNKLTVNNGEVIVQTDGNGSGASSSGIHGNVILNDGKITVKTKNSTDGCYAFLGTVTQNGGVLEAHGGYVYHDSGNRNWYSIGIRQLVFNEGQTTASGYTKAVSVKLSDIPESVQITASPNQNGSNPCAYEADNHSKYKYLQLYYACPHTGKSEIRGAVDPTYESEGYTGDTYCLECGRMFQKGAVIPKLYKTPQTGDNSHLSLWIALLILAGTSMLTLKRKAV